MSNTSSLPTALADRVQHNLLQTRQRLQQFELVRALAQFAIQAVVVLLLVGLVDYFWPMPTIIRALMLQGLAALAVTRAMQHHRRQAELSELTATCAVEQAHPELGQRLRTAFQFRGLPESSNAPKLVSALIEDTNQRTQQIDFGDTVKWSSLLPRTAVLGVMFVFALVLFSIWGETRTTLARVFLIPVHYTKLQITPAEGPVPAGTDAVVRATVTGRPVDEVRLLVRNRDEKKWTEHAMLPPDSQPEDEARGLRRAADENVPAECRTVVSTVPNNWDNCSTLGRFSTAARLNGQLVATLEDCQNDLEYKVVTEPVSSRRFALRVLQPLTQESFSARVQPPPYTNLEPESLDQMDFTVVEGSEVSWQLQLNRTPQEARLIASSAKLNSPPQPLKIDGTTVLCDLTQMLDTQQFEVHAEAADGMKFQSRRIRIRVKKDHGPTVRFVKPEKELEVTPTTEVALGLEVSDDFGLTRVGIEYQIGDGEKQTLWQQDLQGKEKELTTVPVLYLEDHSLNFDDAITYYAFAEDNQQQPRRRRSELQFIDIRPYKREYQIVDGNCSGSSGSCLTLEELIARQRDNLRRTFANTDRQPVSEDLAARLAQTEREICDATNEFSQGWQQRFGPIPSLDAATDAMERAAETLAAKQFDAGLTHQEQALAGLVKARQNFRKFVKNCSSGQFGQCQRFDNEMRQKLRAENKKQSNTQQSLARTRQQLQQLAQNQRQWSQQVAPSGGGGAQLDQPPKPRQPSPSGSRSSSASPSASSNALAQAQQAAAQSARELQDAMRKEYAASELSQQRIDEIASIIEQSRQQMENDARDSAAKQALEAAKLAEQLDEHLKGLGAADLGQRLSLAEQMASRLAASENEVAQRLTQDESSDPTELAEKQRGLAEETETLADLIRYAEANALGDDPSLRRQLGDLQDIHQPGELGPAMQRVASDIDANRRQAAQQGAQAAAGSLAEIARSLGELRRQFNGPQLEQLLAAEEKAAELLRQLQSASGPGSQATLVAQFEQLQRSLSELNVSTSGSPSGQANQNATTVRPGGSPPTPQFGYAGQSMGAELRQIVTLLQARIQDAILLTARMDSDEPVPAKYQRLVEEYYQALSDDLR